MHICNTIHFFRFGEGRRTFFEGCGSKIREEKCGLSKCTNNLAALWPNRSCLYEAGSAKYSAWPLWFA